MPAVSVTVFSFGLVFKVSSRIIQSVMVFVVAFLVGWGVHDKTVHSNSVNFAIFLKPSSGIVT
jgi:hypothetical protein